MTAEDLINILEEADQRPESYSGRCMYGRRCVCVIVPNDAALWDLANKVGLAGQTVPGPSSEGLGGDIVAYWPQHEWPADRPCPSMQADDEDGDED